MWKKILAVLVMLYAAACFAAVDVNKATAAELDGIKGIGPAISSRIIDERKKGSFKDWKDFIDRVKGVGEGNAAKFSTEGLTVGGAAFKGAAAAPAAKAEEKKEAKADAKAKKEAEKKSKDDAKAAEKKAKAEKKEDKKDEKKADATKPAASAAKPAASATKK